MKPAPDQLTVADDRVGAEMGEIPGLFRGAAAQRQGLAVGRGGAAGSALVEEEHAVFVERAVQPAVTAHRTVRAAAGPALEVDQPGEPLALGTRFLRGDDLSCVKPDQLALGSLMVERYVEVIVGEEQFRLTDGRHGARPGRYRCACLLHPSILTLNELSPALKLPPGRRGHGGRQKRR